MEQKGSRFHKLKDSTALAAFKRYVISSVTINKIQTYAGVDNAWLNRISIAVQSWRGNIEVKEYNDKV